MAILNNQPTYWFRTKAFRTVLIVVGVIVVLGLVVFGKQLGQLLDFLGSKAGTAETIRINENTGFLQDATLVPEDSFTVQNGRLMLNDTGQ
ncbi:MAG: hypothetical protein R3B38_02960 [Patescibacteria group bacterium]